MKNFFEKKMIKQETLFHLMALLLIGFCCMYFIDSNTSLKIVGDEFGYWSAGAWMAGYDWSDVASCNAYYSYGYGTILSIILKLGITQVQKYQIAIVFNMIMLVVIYVVAYYLSSKILSRLQMQGRVFLSLAVVLYTGILYYTQYTLVETLINFLYWILLYFAYKLLEKFSIRDFSIFLVILFYMYACHQRTIGILLVSVCFLIYILLYHKEYKHFITLILFFVVLGSVVSIIKEEYIASFLTNESFSMLSKNNFSGQISKIQTILTVDGFLKAIQGYLGKIYYAGTSTCLVYFIAVVAIVKSFISTIKEKTLSLTNTFSIYLLFNSLIMMAITTVFMLEYERRFDLLIYGRYFDFTLAPFLLFVVYASLNSTVTKKELCVVVGGYLLLTVLINYWLPYETADTHIPLFSPGVADFLYGEDKSIWVLSLKAVLIGLIFWTIFFMSKKTSSCKLAGVIIAMCILIGNSLYVSYSAYMNVLSWSVEGCAREEKLAEKIRNLGREDDLYYYIHDGVLTIDYMQFLLGDVSTIHCIYNMADVLTLDEHACILATHSTKLVEMGYLDEYEPIGSSSYLKLWQRK